MKICIITVAEDAFSATRFTAIVRPSMDPAYTVLMVPRPSTFLTTSTLLMSTMRAHFPACMSNSCEAQKGAEKCRKFDKVWDRETTILNYTEA